MLLLLVLLGMKLLWLLDALMLLGYWKCVATRKLLLTCGANCNVAVLLQRLLLLLLLPPLLHVS